MRTTKRMENESAKAYAAFMAYAEMGAQRSQEAVAKKLAKSRQLLSRWSAKFKWQERIVQWDSDNADRAESASEKAELELAREKAKRRDEVQDSAWDLFRRLSEKAKEMLAFPVGQRTVSKDGKTTVIEPVRWRFSDLARIAQVADSLGRLATGMALTKAELTGPDGSPLPSASAAPAEIHLTVSAGESEPSREKIIYLKPLPGVRAG